MTTVILGRDLDALRSCLPPPTEPLRYLILRESHASLNIRAYLQRRGQSHELSRAVLFRERSAWFQTAYAEALGHLNADRASREWWAMPFTTKNPISTDLCRDAFVFLLIVDLARKREGALVVVTESEALAAQVAAWGKTEGVLVVNAVQPGWTVRRLISRLAPLAILLLMVRALWVRFRLGSGDHAQGATGERPAVIVTLVHPHSITAEGRFRDTYFGSLSEWLAARNVPVAVAGIIQGQALALARAFRSGALRGSQVPFDTLLASGEILRCGWDALRAFLRWRSTAITGSTRLEIRGIALDELVRHAVREAHASGDVFRNLYVYRCAERLAERLAAPRCWYPYENRAWEKMLLLGMRAGRSTVRMIGYQHASVTASHINFLLTDDEIKKMPLPDSIVTLGDVTRQWLIRDGHHPAALLKAGCALRQPRTGDAKLRARRSARVVRVLLALATNLNEYVLSLAFLDEAFVATGLCDNDGRMLRIRPHPTIALQEAVQLRPNGQTRFAYEVSTGPVAEDLTWADVVLYASSTIGLEAVGLGVPAVYLDLGDILDTDPMGGWTDLKWIAREPKDLAGVLTAIEALSDQQYLERQRKGQAYVDAYLAPVTDRALQVFCEA